MNFRDTRCAVEHHKDRDQQEERKNHHSYITLGKKSHGGCQETYGNIKDL